MYGIFVRLQTTPEYNPNHRSKHVVEFTKLAKEGEWVSPQEAEAKGYTVVELPGMAALRLRPHDALLALAGLDFVVAYREDYPLLMDWGSKERLLASEVESCYHVLILYGKEIARIEDGVVIRPENPQPKDLLPFLPEELPTKVREECMCESVEEFVQTAQFEYELEPEKKRGLLLVRSPRCPFFPTW